MPAHLSEADWLTFIATEGDAAINKTIDVKARRCRCLWRAVEVSVMPLTDGQIGADELFPAWSPTLEAQRVGAGGKKSSSSASVPWPSPLPRCSTKSSVSLVERFTPGGEGPVGIIVVDVGGGKRAAQPAPRFPASSC